MHSFENEKMEEQSHSGMTSDGWLVFSSNDFEAAQCSGRSACVGCPALLWYKRCKFIKYSNIRICVCFLRLC